MSTFIFIHVKNKFVRVDFSDIRYVLSANHHVKIITEKKTYIPHLRFQQVEEILPADEFARINRSTIVALKRIQYFDIHSVVVDGVTFAFTDRYRKLLEERGCVLVWRDSKAVKPFTVDAELVSNHLS